jgi:hypothetical protein
MTTTSIGSSFSYLRPESVARTTAAAPEPTAREESGATSASDPSRPQATGSSKPSVADNLRALLVKAQEESASRTEPREAARAYGGQ